MQKNFGSFFLALLAIWRSTQAGRRGAPAKGVGRETGARVRIPPSPPTQMQMSTLVGVCIFCL